MRITTAQPIWCINENSLDETFRREIAHTFETGTDEACSAIAFVFENPFRRHVALLLLSEGSQRRRLTGDRVLLLLLVRRHPGVDCSGLHRQPPSHRHRCEGSAPDQD